MYIVYANKQLQWLITESNTRFYRFLFLFFTFVIATDLSILVLDYTSVGEKEKKEIWITAIDIRAVSSSLTYRLVYTDSLVHMPIFLVLSLS